MPSLVERVLQLLRPHCCRPGRCSFFIYAFSYLCTFFAPFKWTDDPRQRGPSNRLQGSTTASIDRDISVGSGWKSFRAQDRAYNATALYMQVFGVCRARCRGTASQCHRIFAKVAPFRPSVALNVRTSPRGAGERRRQFSLSVDHPGAEGHRRTEPQVSLVTAFCPRCGVSRSATRADRILAKVSNVLPSYGRNVHTCIYQ